MTTNVSEATMTEAARRYKRANINGVNQNLKLGDFGDTGVRLMAMLGDYQDDPVENPFLNLFIHAGIGGDGVDPDIGYALVKNFILGGVNDAMVLDSGGWRNAMSFYRMKPLAPFPKLTNTYYDRILKDNGPEVLFIQDLVAIEHGMESEWTAFGDWGGNEGLYMLTQMIKERLQDPEKITIISSYTNMQDVDAHFGHSLARVMSKNMTVI